MPQSGTGVSPVSSSVVLEHPVVEETHGRDAHATEDGHAAGEAHATEDGHATKQWMPWFPVIDYDRCANCLQCVSFCLFGVYQKDAGGKITVANPHKCKTYCPACSRVCPCGAIMFPKHPQATINGREIPKRTSTSKTSSHENVLESLVKGDVYETLRRRQKGDAISDGPAGTVPDEIPPAMLESLVQKHIERLAGEAKPGEDRQ
jgi:NAD-dependent dihydropyrimidine dehydrogenase PreA subunit